MIRRHAACGPGEEGARRLAGCRTGTYCCPAPPNSAECCSVEEEEEREEEEGDGAR